MPKMEDVTTTDAASDRTPEARRYLKASAVIRTGDAITHRVTSEEDAVLGVPANLLLRGRVGLFHYADSKGGEPIWP
jgi:hypothetical protein